MENISRKLLLISKLYEFNNNNLKNCKKLVNNVNINNNMNEINNNSVKMLKIGFEKKKELCFDENEDKQRQSYKQLKCFWPKCQFIAKYESELNRHILFHSDKRQFVCEECNKQFQLQSILTTHKNTVHSTDRPFVCPRSDCKKRFKTESNLQTHKRSHSSIIGFECDICNKRFESRKGFRYHRSYVHSNDRPFVCPQNNCNKRFKTEKYLNYHKRSHSSTNRFECDICHKGFKTKEGFDYHRSYVHSNDRPFVCPRSDCNKRFKTKLYLQYHELTHSSVKNFRCNKCDKRFKTNINLNYHKKRNHIKFKRPKCLHNNCNKTYSSLSQLKVHTNYKHSTDRPFKCNFQQCQTSSKSKSYLN